MGKIILPEEIRKNNTAVRNPDGIWINSKVFSEEAQHFDKYEYYCPDPVDTPDWIEYWTTQLNRCINGYTSGGVHITGHHYFYLNFSRIMIEREGNKIEGFPDFWDGDYNYFWALDIARKGCTPEFFKELNLNIKIKDEYLTGGRHLMVGKSRRKGYSFKNAAVCVNIYNTIRKTKTLITGFDKKYSGDTMEKAQEFINFLSESTGWGKARLRDKSEHLETGYIEYPNGVKVIKGYRSQIISLTYQDNPDAGRGKDSHTILMEEMGTFANAIDSFWATDPSTKAGDIRTGQIIMFGTGGDMNRGTVDFNEMFYDPNTYDILPMVNIWDEDAENTSCGFFHPVYWNKERYYDSQGNSNIEEAVESEKINREKKSTSYALRKYTTEYPMTPGEAFQSVTANVFPTRELTVQKNKVETQKLYITKGQPVNLFVENKKVVAKPIMNLGSITPLYHYRFKTDDYRGCPIIIEHPPRDIPKGLYKIGYDPYGQDVSEGLSLGAVYVYKSIMQGEYTKNIIVAYYVGRPESTETMNRIAYMLAELYNTEVMHENMFIHVKNFFLKIKKAHRLARQPDHVISKNIKKSKVARVWGCHMSDELKDAGENYIKDWLLTVADYDENGDEVLNLERIYDIGLIEELIKYNRKGNFDRVMAFMMIMFQIQEDKMYDITHKRKDKTIVSELTELIPQLFQKNRLSL